MSEGTGVAICESDDPLALASWALNWNTFLDLETRLVLDDAEARELGLQRMAQQSEIKTTIVQN